MKARLAHLQTLANIAGAGLLLWLGAPLVAIGGRHPFDSGAARAGALLAIGLLALLIWAATAWLRRRRNARLFDQMQGASGTASAALSERFASAARLLQAGLPTERGTRPRWWARRRQIYQLPWYVFIGAPGAGKTTALLHSGLQFPLAERLGAEPVAGVGGTRQCDWWFTDQAVFIDTAGRYTTQDSHGTGDALEWQLFVTLLRRYRPVQPINGVIVTVSVPDLLQGGAELERQASAVDQRLQELREQLGLSFPVYLLVTKVDLLAGFVEFFGDLDAAQREQVWGINFDHPPPADAPPLPHDLAARLAGLPARIAAIGTRRLQEEPLLQRRAAIYHFAAQVEALLPALEGFARHAFRTTAAAPRQPVRSIHLSSGTQEGNPIDRVLGEVRRSYGIALRAPPRPDDTGKAFFLATLLQRLVIAEAALAGTNLTRQRRRRWLAAGTGTLLATALLLACGGWWFSYRSNLGYVAAVSERVQQVAREIDPAKTGRIDQLLPLYATLSQLAASGQVDPARPPWGFDFGLFQGPRLARSADQTYHRVLDRTLAPLLAQRLHQALRQDADPVGRYEALRVGLMLTTPGRLDRGEVRRWAASAFAAPVLAATPATAGAGLAPGAGEQQEWLHHLDALLERNAVLDAVRLDEATLRTARAALAAVPFEQRVYERLMRRAREQLAGDQTLADLVSPAAVLVFAPQDAAAGMPAIPAVYTRQAWRERIEPAVDAGIVELADEAGWVLGEAPAAVQRLRAEGPARDAVARQLGLRHAQATIARWDRLFASLALQVPGDAPSLTRFTDTLAAPDSPLRQLLSRIATEFPPPGAAPVSSPATLAFESASGTHFAALRDYTRTQAGAAIDRLLLPVAALAREPVGPASIELGRELRAEAGRAPAPLREIWIGLADAIAVQPRRAADRAGAFGELTQACRKLTAERFPFTSEATRDMPHADFARVFGPQGLLDSYFRTQLAGQVDTRSRPWRLRGAASEKAQAALRSFEMAEDIRRLFFPAGSALPQLRLQLTPVSMDGELLLFSADVDGQLLRYENGPRRSKPLVWPGPAATQKVLLRILPAGPSGVGAEVHEGPWALLRVLQRRGWQRGNGSAPVARMDVDGRALSLEVTTTDTPVSPALIADLARFRCPEAW